MVAKVGWQGDRIVSRTNGLREKTMKATMVVFAVVLTAVFAASAFAGGNSSAKSAYGNKGTKVQAVVGKHAVLGAQKTVKGTTLPFTGQDLGFVAGAGVLLVGMGFGVRRLTRKQPPAA